MNKHLSFLIFATALAVSLFSYGCKTAKPTAGATLCGGDATPEMLTRDYWQAPTDIIMNSAQIAEYNAQLLHMPELDLIDISTWPDQINGNDIRQSIEQYDFASKNIYLDTVLMTESDKAELLASRNMEGIPEQATVRFGLVCAPTDVRSFPTYRINTDDGVTAGAFCFDRFQQTQFRVGEGVAILHQTADASWFYVRNLYYAGWVSAENIALCSRQQMLDYTCSNDYVITLEQKEVTVFGHQMRIKMGTRLARDGRDILWPVRNADGTCVLQKATLDIKTANCYLDYTSANVLDLLFALLGSEYGWGDREGFNDCSSTVVSVYSCFGFKLPRDTSKMHKMRTVNHAVENGKYDYTNLMPGSLVLTPGHVMMLVGTVDGKPFVIHNTTASHTKDLTPVYFGKTILSSLDGMYSSANKTLKDRVSHIVEIRPE